MYVCGVHRSTHEEEPSPEGPILPHIGSSCGKYQIPGPSS